MRYVLKKLAALVLTLFIVSLLAFLAFQVISGDPVTQMLGTEATEQAKEELREELGLNRPIPVRYLDWVGGFLTGDLGVSYSYHMPVREMLHEKLAITGILTVMSFVFTVILAIPLGILTGSVRSKVLDGIITAVDQMTMSIPPFFLGILTCFLFGMVLRWFEPGSFVSYTEDWGACLSYLVFPALSIAVPRAAMTVKMLRGSIFSQMELDYVRTAQSRGNGRTSILIRQVLKNAMLPVITFLAVSAAEIMTGTIIVEQVFTVPGIGRLLMASISNRDFPVVQAIVVILAAWIVIVNFVADLLTQMLDPRIRLR